MKTATKPKFKKSKPLSVGIAAVLISVFLAAAITFTGCSPESQSKPSDSQLSPSQGQAAEQESPSQQPSANETTAETTSGMTPEEIALEKAYWAATTLLANGEYEASAEAFRELGDYRDSALQAELALLEGAYAEAEALSAAGKHAQAGIAFAKLEPHRDSRERSFDEWNRTRTRRTVCVGISVNSRMKFIAAVKNDGTVYFTGSNASKLAWEVSQWKNILELYCSNETLFGLRTDGTVVIAGDRTNCKDVESWTDVIALADSDLFLFGLRSDGSVATTGMYQVDNFREVSQWTDIVDVAATDKHIVGLKKDGTLVSAGDNTWGQCRVESWENVVSVRVEGIFSMYTTTGITADGQVLTAGNMYRAEAGTGVRDAVWMQENYILYTDGTMGIYDPNFTYPNPDMYTYNAQQEAAKVSGWRNIKSVFLRPFYDYSGLYGIQEDGRVVAFGINHNGSMNVSEWTDIVAIYSSSFYFNSFTVGLRRDGTLVIAESIRSDAETWTDVRMP